MNILILLQFLKRFLLVIKATHAFSVVAIFFRATSLAKLRFAGCLLICSLFLQGFIYQEQELEPVTISEVTRVIAPKQKRYPVLEEMEKLLYPSKNFIRENPDARLERLEIAVLGVKQDGSIKDRLSKLETEISSWQIAEVTKKEKIKTERPIIIKENQNYVARSNINAPRPRDYNYMNYRLVTPLLQNIGRRGVNLVMPVRK